MFLASLWILGPRDRGKGSMAKILVAEVISRVEGSTLGEVKGDPSCGFAVEGAWHPCQDGNDSKKPTHCLPAIPNLWMFL
ncbi:hypothetical protein TIFTF001_027181 [Ficus carica]|uniref:Uncharacterized protein n=1 Tax=Ficus carica TaxID=3494 RepID=A0AA88DMK1_FICCA|nr:hypothetical protein TIFTF001_027181 [Ficus carica]